MEATAVSVGKAVLEGAVDYAKSAVAGEIALQLGVERDVGYVADELEMMQSFLMTADEERDKNNKVLNTWVKQVRNVAYNVEDSLVDFEIHAESEKPPLLGCIPRNPCDRRRIAREVKELKAKVEDVSSRNLRYRLIKDTAGSSNPAFGVEHGHGNDAAWRVAMEQEKAKVNLDDLIISKVVDLQVMAVWGTSGNLGKISVISKVFDDPNVKAKFGCRAWVRLMHPFDPKVFLQSLVNQFYVNSSRQQENSVHQEGTIAGADILLKTEKMGQTDFIHEFKAEVSNNRYLIVINDLVTIEEWHSIKTYFPDKKNGSRIIVATQQSEIASLCPEPPYQMSILENILSDQVLYLFHKKVEEPETDSPKHNSLTATGASNSVVSPSEMQEEGAQQQHSAGNEHVVSTTPTIGRKFYRSKTVIPEDVFVGRSIEKQKIIGLIGQPNDRYNVKVISVWGMGGIGKTTLVRSVYQSQQLSGWKRAWATVLRPFSRHTLLRNLALQLQDPVTSVGEKNITTMESTELEVKLSGFLESHDCLLVIDDISSIEEWNSLKPILSKSKRIIATTREKFIAMHCSEDDRNMHNLSVLEEDTAIDLFKKKVFKGSSNFDLDPGMLDLAKQIVKKCDALPLAIATIGAYLANRPRNSMEWRKLNSSLSDEIEINPELKMINAALMRSYDGLPYHLKSCFLYLSIFPEDHIIRRKHVVKRWIAEGFSREMHHMTATQVGTKYFDELLARSMTLPLEEAADVEINSCRLHDLIREICVSKAREENLVYTLEEGSSRGVGAKGTIRHLVVSSNWKRDKEVMQSMLDLSHLRSLTVFGEWRSYFISDKMRFLRVLDLEHTIGLRDHHLDQIVKILHLRFLSLRGCMNILTLPDSLANLRQLQSLDIRGTWIWTLPTTITSLQKLQYLYASGSYSEKGSPLGLSYKFFLLGAGHGPCSCHWNSCIRKGIHLCYTGCLLLRPQLLEDHWMETGEKIAEGVSRRDVISLYRNRSSISSVPNGVELPKGISRLKALHTLRGVNVSGRKATLQELCNLTQLRKLEVSSVDSKHIEKLWRAIAGHDQLVSLSLSVIRRIRRGRGRFSEEEIDGCLGEGLSPPKQLVSLKLSGLLVKVPEWIHRLQSLSKLQLHMALVKEDAIHAIGMLPNLAVLRLNHGSVRLRKLRFQGSSFPSLLVLEFNGLFGRPLLESIEFEPEATPRLELLQAYSCDKFEEISGLQFLLSLKEIRVDRDDLKELVQRELAEYPNNVILKLK